MALKGCVWGRGRTSLRARVYAIVATMAAQLFPVDKMKAFNMCKGVHPIKDKLDDTEHFILNTWTRFIDDDTLEDRPRPGRPHHVDEGIAKDVAALLKEGHVVNGRKLHYHSIHEACQFNPIIAALVDASGYDPEKVLRHAMEVDPELTMKVEEVKMEMPARLKEEREAVAKKKLRLPWAELFNVVFIDEMKMELEPPRKSKVLCSRGEPIFPVEDARLNKKRKEEKIILVAIYAVNPIMGAVHMQFLTGTSEITTGYTVSHAFYKSPKSTTACPSGTSFEAIRQSVGYLGLYIREVAPSPHRPSASIKTNST